MNFPLVIEDPECFLQDPRDLDLAEESQRTTRCPARPSFTISCDSKDQQTAASMINSGKTESEALLGQPQGLTVLMTAVYMVGEMAGSGVLTLPYAVEATGWIGLVLIPVCGFISSFTGGILGECWQIVQERYPDMKGPVRYPYPAIAMKTFGKPARILISCSINFTLFGVSCVFSLLAAQNIHSIFVDNHWSSLSFCYWLIIIIAVLFPACLLATPKEFKPVAMGASVATLLACVILVVLMVRDYDRHVHQPIIHDKVDWLNFAGAFGTICFAFGGHPTFPTIQNDMRKPQMFGRACIIAYIVIVVLYLPVAAVGFFVYGKHLQDNVLEVVSVGIPLTIIQAFITIHLFCGFIIVLNPVCQELEEFFEVPMHFGYKRLILRTVLLGAVLLVTESIPRFGTILSLIGGSTTVLLTYIAPSMFYIKLCRMKGEWPEIQVPLAAKVALVEIGLVATFAGCIATYSAFKNLLSPGTFTLPCFVNVTAAGGG